LSLKGTAAAGPVLTYRLHNAGADDIHVLRWGTPFVEAAREDFARVERNGHEVKYLGPRYKRGEPVVAGYSGIPAGQPVSREVDLAASYDLSVAGDYEITLRYGFMDVVVSPAQPPRRRRDFRPMKPESSAAKLRLAVGVPAPARRRSEASAGASYSGCSPTQTSDVSAVLGIVQGKGVGTAPVLNTAAQGSTQWTSCDNCVGLFGAFDTTRLAGLVTNYDATLNDSYGAITFHCDGNIPNCGTCPSSSTYAFTCGPPDIGLCGQFWKSQPEFAEDSQSGTVVHELSHWQGTSDYKYGCGSCKTLASDTPSEAVLNADSYEYFAEFTVAGKKACGFSGHVLVSILVAAFSACVALGWSRPGRRT